MLHVKKPQLRRKAGGAGGATKPAAGAVRVAATGARVLRAAARAIRSGQQRGKLPSRGPDSRKGLAAGKVSLGRKQVRNA